MKLIHTADWHLGQILYEHDRRPEQEAFLAELADIVRREQPDALLVAGDVFDRPNPSNAVQKMYCRGMLALREACPGMTLAVIAGNHDGKAMLDADSALWRYAGVHVVSLVSEDPDRHLIPVQDSRTGRPAGWIAAVPHQLSVRPSFFQTLLDRARAVAGHLPVVLAAHLAVTGSDLTGHDPEIIGGLDACRPEDLGTGYDYLALGHIHRPQTLRRDGRTARYSGAPLPVSFDENFLHSVSVVTLGESAEPQIREIPVHNPRPLLTVPEVPLPFGDALAALAELDPAEAAYIRLQVLADGPLPSNYMERIRLALQGSRAGFCHCLLRRPEERGPAQAAPLTCDEFRQLSPLEVARRYWQARFGAPMEEVYERMLAEAAARAAAETGKEEMQ